MEAFIIIHRCPLPKYVLCFLFHRPCLIAYFSVLWFFFFPGILGEKGRPNPIDLFYEALRVQRRKGNMLATSSHNLFHVLIGI